MNLTFLKNSKRVIPFPRTTKKFEDSWDNLYEPILEASKIYKAISKDDWKISSYKSNEDDDYFESMRQFKFKNLDLTVEFGYVSGRSKPKKSSMGDNEMFIATPAVAVIEPDFVGDYVTVYGLPNKLFDHEYEEFIFKVLPELMINEAIKIREQNKYSVYKQYNLGILFRHINRVKRSKRVFVKFLDELAKRRSEVEKGYNDGMYTEKYYNSMIAKYDAQCINFKDRIAGYEKLLNKLNEMMNGDEMISMSDEDFAKLCFDERIQLFDKLAESSEELILKEFDDIMNSSDSFKELKC